VTWEHHLFLEKKEAKDMVVPWCLDGAGVCPPEDVGGYMVISKCWRCLKSPVIRKSRGILNGWAWNGIPYGIRREETDGLGF